MIPNFNQRNDHFIEMTFKRPLKLVINMSCEITIFLFRKDNELTFISWSTKLNFFVGPFWGPLSREARGRGALLPRFYISREPWYASAWERIQQQRAEESEWRNNKNERYIIIDNDALKRIEMSVISHGFC